MRPTGSVLDETGMVVDPDGADGAAVAGEVGAGVVDDEPLAAFSSESEPLHAPAMPAMPAMPATSASSAAAERERRCRLRRELVFTCHPFSIRSSRSTDEIAWWPP